MASFHILRIAVCIFIIGLASPGLQAQYSLYPIDTLTFDNGEIEPEKRLRSPKTWIENDKIRIMDFIHGKIWEYDLRGNHLRVVNSGSYWGDRKDSRDIWQYLFRRKNKLMTEHMFPVHDFQLQGYRIAGKENFFIFDPDGKFCRIQMGLKLPHPHKKSPLKPVGLYDKIYPWTSSDHQYMVIPLLDNLPFRGSPRQDEHFTFNLAFCQLSDRKRPGLIIDHIESFAFNSKVTPDPLVPSGINWQLASGSQNQIHFLSNHVSPIITEIDANGKAVQEFGESFVHPSNIQSQRPNYEKFSRNQENNLVQFLKTQRWKLETNEFIGLGYDNSQNMLVRTYRQGIRDTSSSEHTLHDKLFRVNQQLSQAPHWLQIYPLANPDPSVEEIPFPINNHLLSIKDGILYTLLPFNRRSQTIEIVRYKLSNP